MSDGWRVRVDRALREGEIAGLYSTTAMLILVEFCFVYWLHRIQIPEPASDVTSGFIVIPPWHREPRFEITLLLTILAGLLFWVCAGLWGLWRHLTDARTRNTAVQSLKRRVRTTTSVAALTGAEMALFTWLRG